MRPSEWVLIAVLLVAVTLAAVAGLRRAPRRDLSDPRLSTELAGPDGAKALKQVLARFGIAVEPRRRGLFDLGADTLEVDRFDLVALLDITERPTNAERQALVRYVERGGAVFLAGWNYDVEECFEYRVVSLREAAADSMTVTVPTGVGVVPTSRAVLAVGPAREREAGDALEEECSVLTPMTVDTLLQAEDARPVAMRLGFSGGGRVLSLADAQYLSNRVLKETDAAALVLPWLLAEAPRRVVVDEYHHGFGGRRSIVGATWSWTRSNPAGWMVLQLSLAALVAILTASLRFGPALDVVERRRRSAMEHVDALALGLQRADGHRAAASLIVRGLRRRLGRQEVLSRAAVDLDDWLASLALGARTPEARATVGELGRLVRAPESEAGVLQVALAVEDVWNALGHEKTYTPS